MLGSTMQYRRAANLTFGAMNAANLVELKEESDTERYQRAENLATPGFVKYIPNNEVYPLI